VAYDKVALIGFGEAGPVFARAFLDAGVGRVSAYDILIDDPATASAQKNKTEALGVEAATNPAQAARDAALIVSTVTADQTVIAAESIAPSLCAAQLYLDLNSTSPGIKRQAAAVVEAVGASFVEGVAMDTVPVFGARVPILVCGPAADGLARELNALGLRLECVGPSFGQASSAKMLRSVLIKGFAALYAESMTAAAKLGLESRVIASLAVTFPGLDWEKEIAYYLGRSAIHAKRQAAEMRVSAETVRDLGVEPMMAAAAAARLQWAADLDLADHYHPGEVPTVADYARAVAAAEQARKSRDHRRA
jgi:3-hydroxyisobutyrate dehydrogenase-like beta-hydroxyacid dehydrogenase